MNHLKDKHRPTIDDLQTRTFLIENSKLTVDFLDTSGDDEVLLQHSSFILAASSQFPAMRRLSIKSGHGFVLVYSVTSALSLEVVKLRLQEILDTKVNSEVKLWQLQSLRVSPIVPKSCPTLGTNFLELALKL